MPRVVAIGKGLLRHDGEVEGVVMKDDAVLELCVRGRAHYAQAHIPKRRSHQGAPSVLQHRLLRHEELVGVLRSAVGMFEEGHHRGTHAPQADITMGVKIVLFPASFSNLLTTPWLRFSSSRARSCALTPSSLARAPLPSDVSDPIVTIETSKMTLALEDGSK